MKTMTKFMTFLLVCSAMLCFSSCGKDDEPKQEEDNNKTEIYAGKDFVGTWQGSDGSDEYVIQLDADGTYTDWLVFDGQKTAKETGKYTVSGNTLTAPGNSNICSAWMETPFTMTFNGKNQMTLVNSLMSDFKQKLVLTRK